ncbi:hypothetical protein SeMB42_g07528 [Synchytrium endobioticum]|uniref:Uncharacterized protein n=1 Tax=Synchytrium endobioticum TaxID=286115 RepID=A0A507C690_9FUNG|nr:hypothetical protein SeMB42_g07528 [Synchytrium endobioticum]
MRSACTTSRDLPSGLGETASLTSYAVMLKATADGNGGAYLQPPGLACLVVCGMESDVAAPFATACQHGQALRTAVLTYASLAPST